LRTVLPALALLLTAAVALFAYGTAGATRQAAQHEDAHAAHSAQPVKHDATGHTAASVETGNITPQNHNGSPRGRIAFASDRDGNFEIYVMNPDGSGQFRLTNDPGEDTQPAWSPDGQRLAFVSTRDGNQEIYIMSADGSNQQRVTNNPSGADYAPAWSPNGQVLAFTSELNGNDEIVILQSLADVPVAGPYTAQNITKNQADDLDPAWSPDGTKLAFASNRAGGYDIFTMNADGTNATRLTTSQNDDVRPSWVQNKITFESERDNNLEIYSMNADGSNQTNLTTNPAEDITPDRSFEGARVVFASNRDGNFELYAANPAGQNLVRLTTNDDATDFQPSVQRLAVPANAPGRLFVAMLDGSQEVPPTTSPARGVGTLLLSQDETTARVSLTFSGLTSTQTMAHIHGAAPPGVNAPIIFPLPLGTFSDFQITLTTAQVQQLKAGLFYFNVHTTNFPGGEIRGQINAAPQSGVNTAPPSNIYALTVGGRLLTINSALPNFVLANVAITGLQSGESLLGLDIRPANGQLYALGSTSRLYNINPQTGAATAVGSGAFTPALVGNEFGFDFNPTVDRIRVTSDAGQNLRLNPDTGAVAATDTNLAYAATDTNAGATPRVSGVAYTNNAAGATTTTLYDIDYNLDVLATQNPPNNGTLNTVGALGVNTGRFVGFDISQGGGIAFASLSSPDDSVSRLYTLDLSTGAATLLGDIGSTQIVRDIAVGATALAGLAQSSYTVAEDARRLVITVTRTGDLTGAAVVEYDTNDGTATERRDYTTARGTLRFAPGEASKSFTIFINDDRYLEEDETFTVTLSSPVGVGFSGPTTATVTIKDNEATAAATPNPIDDTPFFVRQQYIDFLNREPEQGGFDAWVNVLNNCSNRINNPLCDRVTVSAAFFRSAEYQIKGAFAIRFYLAALNRLPTYREFILDLSELNGATADEVNANRAAFADRFLQREEVRAALESLSNAAFVDRLIANAAVTIPNRNQLVADLNAGTKTRGQVLREIVETQAFALATTNRAFVLSQYFGYLRRDPDPAGFQGWLNYLNANPTDFRTMVRGFMDSIEYRLRFGQP
jgi:WD40 repeat protein